MLNRSFLLVSLVVVGIVYGSLYPFAFHVPSGHEGALASFVATWRQPPQSRGDLLANLLFYFPLGVLCVGPLVERFERIAVVVLTVAIGAALSLTMELTQHFVGGRVSAMSDFYLNTIGTAAGAFIGLAWGRELLTVRIIPRDASPFAAMLLLAWLGWRLFPYEPVIDLHKYWASIKPLVLTPSLGVYDIFRFAAMWGAVTYLIQFGLKVEKPLLVIATVMAAVFGAKMLITDQVITLPEVIGALFAFCYLAFVLRSQPQFGARLLAAMFLLSLALERILPLQLANASKSFEWIPFFSFLHGSMAVNLQSFLQKAFLYGSGLALLTGAGLSLLSASFLEGATLLATSLLETSLAGRSAEITDTVMVFLLAAVCQVSMSRRPPARHEDAQS